MKLKRIVKWSITLGMVLVITACNAAPAAVQGTPDLAATVAMSVALAQTVAAAQTQTAEVLNPATTAPEFTETPQITLTSTVGYTPTSQGVYLTVSKDTNCRVGPNSAFAVAVTLKPGDRVEVLGTNPNNDSYYVVNPQKSYAYCWAWGEFATLEGNAGSLPVFTPQPTPTPTRTPTPAVAYDFSFVNVRNCGGDYYLNIYTKNTGGSPLHYVYVSMYDESTATGFTHSANKFTEYSGCDISNEQGDIVKGEMATVSTYNPGQFNYDPTGHSIAVELMLCTAENMAGTCISRKFNVTP